MWYYPCHMEKLTAESKKELIGRTLRAEIEAGKFAGHFPSERALVRRFAAARETVRAALRDLEDDNLIRRCVGSGTTVTFGAVWRRTFAILLGNGYNTNPFYTAMRSGVERALAKRGGSLFSVSSFGYRESERMASAREFVRMCIQERMAGVFYQPLHFLRNGERANRAVLSALDAAKIPVVLIDSDFVQPPQRSAYDLVGTDNLRIGYDLARHMIEAGAKRIAYVTRPKPAPTSMLRGMGVGFAVSEAGLRWRTEDMMFVRYSDAETSAKHPDADVRATAKRIAADKKRPDALIVGDDYLGVVLMESLREEGLKVPDDILVAGVNGDPVSGKSDPPLTTFVQPCEEIGAAAVDLMLSRIENPSLPPREVMMASRFVPRTSTMHSRKTQKEKE